uniref:Homeodomain-related n=1 Tax=Medicago truncatula TaxID=3880 RepID=A2Q6A1_MEDTR|nr:Homeodomain-related [Medicago truncatula]
MTSSNKHWPSMFKKSTNASNQRNSQGLNSSLLTGGDGEERTPEPKPRWNPKPQQIRILEAIFNSGMVNPPREEITKIREQLQEFGQVGDANVFYWFQNRKSRSKQKKRFIHNKKRETQQNSGHQTLTSPPNSSSSSSSGHQKASPDEIVISNNIGFSNANDGMVVFSNSPAVSVNQNQVDAYFQTPTGTDLQLPTPPFFSFPVQNHINEVVPNAMTPPHRFNHLSGFMNYGSENGNSSMVQPLPQQNVDVPLVNHEITMNYGSKSGIASMNHRYDQEKIQEEAMNMIHMYQQDPQLNFGVATTSSNDDESVDLAPLPPTTIGAPDAVPFPIIDHRHQGFGVEDEAEKCMVITKDAAFKVDAGPFNVRASFGDRAVLFDSSGTPVLTDEWGVTLDSLHHGAEYYLREKLKQDVQSRSTANIQLILNTNKRDTQ